jgi:hypothetical protein
MADYEAQIHARWAADGTLNGLLASTRVHTGPYSVVDPKFPFATITFPGGRPREYSNDDTIAYPTVQITVYHGMDYHDEAKAIIDAVVAAFDRADFTLTGGDSVLNMQLTSEPSQLQDEDGDWYMIASFECMVLIGA